LEPEMALCVGLATGGSTTRARWDCGKEERGMPNLSWASKITGEHK